MGKSFFTVSFYGEKTQLLKGGCRIAPIRTKPSKRRVRVTVTRLFHQDLAILSFALGSLPPGRRKQIRLGKGESALRVEFKGKIRTQVVPGRL